MPAKLVFDADLVARAQAAGIDVVATCHAALRRAIEEEARAGLRAETAAAIAEWNDWAATQRWPGPVCLLQTRSLRSPCTGPVNLCGKPAITRSAAG